MAKALKNPVYYDIGGMFLQETEDAILLGIDGDEIWLPKSQIEYDEDHERGDYMEVEVPDWLCEQKGLDDGDGIGKKAPPAEIPPVEAAPEPPVPIAYGEGDTVALELFIDNILDDMLIVNLTGKYNANREYEPVEKNNEAFELPLDAVATVDEIKIGAHIVADVNARAAVEAGLIEPPRSPLGENSTWLKKDTIPYSFDLTKDDKIKLAKQMAEAQGKIAGLELELAETRKSLKAEIDVLQAELSEAAKIFRSGKAEPVPVKCDVIQDWNTDELVWVSADEQALELQRRKMTPEEKQPSLFKKPPDQI